MLYRSLRLPLAQPAAALPYAAGLTESALRCCCSSSKLWRNDEWLTHLEVGAEQAYRTALPQVYHCSSVQRALLGLGGASPELARTDPSPIDRANGTATGDMWLPSTRLVCHDSEDSSHPTPSLFAVPLPVATIQQEHKEDAGGVAIACGPERGWTDHEFGMLQRAGFVSAHLGPSVS